MNWFAYDLLRPIGLVIIGLMIILQIRLVFVLIPATIEAYMISAFTYSTSWASTLFLTSRFVDAEGVVLKGGLFLKSAGKFEDVD